MEPTKRRKRTVSFNPNHEYITDAVADFLKSGGQIKRLETEARTKTDSIRDSWIESEDNSEADDFLND